MRYRLSPLAETDLIEAWVYVAEEAGEPQADTVIGRILEALVTLAEFPSAGRRRPEFGSGVRSYPVASYVIYYQPADVLLVSRVLHGRRDQLAAWRHSPQQEGE